jgi:hypothetical protein
MFGRFLRVVRTQEAMVGNPALGGPVDKLVIAGLVRIEERLEIQVHAGTFVNERVLERVVGLGMNLNFPVVRPAPELA